MLWVQILPGLIVVVAMVVSIWYGRRHPAAFRAIRTYTQLVGGTAFLIMGAQHHQLLSLGLGFYFLVSAFTVFGANQPQT